LRGIAASFSSNLTLLLVSLLNRGNAKVGPEAEEKKMKEEEGEGREEEEVVDCLDLLSTNFSLGNAENQLYQEQILESCICALSQ
jgi:hypothetical protein